MSIVAIIAVIAMGVILGMTGGGGSIMAVPILIYLMGVDEKSAIATSLLLVGATSAVAMFGYARKKNIDYRIGAIFGVFGMIGAYLGGFVARYIPGSILIALFAGLMLMAAFAMFRPSKVSEDGVQKESLPMLPIALEGVVVGAVTGLVGAGGGFLVVPALVLMSGLSMKRAIGTSLMVITLKSFAGFAGYVAHVPVDWALAGEMIMLSVVGALVGSYATSYVDGKRLKQGFGVFVLMMGVFVLLQQAPVMVPVSVIVSAMVAAGMIGVSFALSGDDEDATIDGELA